jgi:hypothetical protein
MMDRETGLVLSRYVYHCILGKVGNLTENPDLLRAKRLGGLCVTLFTLVDQLAARVIRKVAAKAKKTEFCKIFECLCCVLWTVQQHKHQRAWHYLSHVLCFAMASGKENMVDAFSALSFQLLGQTAKCWSSLLFMSSSSLIAGSCCLGWFLC